MLIWIPAYCANNTKNVQNQTWEHQQDVANHHYAKPRDTVQNLPLVSLTEARDQKAEYCRYAPAPSLNGSLVDDDYRRRLRACHYWRGLGAEDWWNLQGIGVHDGTLGFRLAKNRGD